MGLIKKFVSFPTFMSYFFRSIYFLNKGLSGILGHFQKNTAFFCPVKMSECNALSFSKLKTQIVS